MTRRSSRFHSCTAWVCDLVSLFFFFLCTIQVFYAVHFSFFSPDKLDDRGHIYFTPFYHFPGGRNFRHSDEGRGRFLSMEAGHGGTRRNPHWADNNKRLSAFLSSPDVVSPDGLATTGDWRVILKGKVETPLYTVYRSQFPPHLKQPKGE